MPQFDAVHFPSQIIWLVAAIVVLHFLLSKIALPRVNEIITTREQAIIGDVERAEELHKTAEELRAQIAEQNAATLAEAQRIFRGGARFRGPRVRSRAGKRRQSVWRSEPARESSGCRALRDVLSGATDGIETDQDESRRDAAAQVERIAWDVAAALVEKIQGRSADAGAVMEAVRNRTRAV